MTKVTCDLAVSVDGFVAGPHQDRDHPLGVGGMRLHEWHFDGGLPEDLAIAEEWMQVGAHVMGRNMFGPDRGEWDLDWTGWWGPEPPYHVPVFVLSHHEREPVEMDGGTTFHFVTGGIETALDQARAAAGDQNVAIAGGASTVNQYLAAGLIDQLEMHVVPVLLGEGERLFTGVEDLTMKPARVIASPAVTHVRYDLS